MRVLLFHTHSLGGVDHLRALSCHLSRKGVEVHLLSPCPWTFPQDARVNVHPFEGGGMGLHLRLFSLSTLHQLSSLVKEKHIDVVNAHGLLPAGLNAAFNRELTRLPFRLVTTLHGSDLPSTVWDGETRAALRYGLSRSDALTAVSSHVATQLGQHLRLESLPRVQVVPPFVQQGTSPERARVAGPPVVVHVTNYRQMKRSRDALFVLKAVLGERKVTLLMVGTGPDRLACERLAKHLGVQNHVRFLNLPGDLGPTLRQGQVLLLPAEHETSNLLSMQALQWGVPIVAAQAGSTPEVVLPQRTGTLHPVGDVQGMARGVLQVLSQWEQYHQEALAFSGSFHPDRLTSQYLQVYQHSLTGEGRQGGLLKGSPVLPLMG